VNINKSTETIGDISFVVFQIEESDLNLTDATELKKSIEMEVNNQNLNIAIDLKSFNTINSTGLGILIGCLKIVNSVNGKFKLLNVNEKIFNIFKITKLHQIFEF
jgi:anti-sigma B factor antagonist